jgi:hypothetical protein
MSVVLREVLPTSTSWQVPPFEAAPTIRLGWVEEAIQEGEGYISGQRSYRNLAHNMRIFDGIFNDRRRSTLVSNDLKYNIRKFVETISDVREIGTVGSDATQYKQFAEIENNVMKCIYTEAQFPRQLRKALQWAAVTGVGYLWPKCKAEDYGFGERQIIFDALGLLDVLPVQVPANNDIQEAYAVTIYEYMPIAEAHARFPLFQASLLPVNQCTYPSRLTAKRLDWAEKFRYGGETRNWGNLYCEIRYTFVRDLRINKTGFELPMGDVDTSWFYKVPTLGQDIPGGVLNNQHVMRKAQLQDCRVYPNLRLMITNPGVSMPMYDGPAFDWHGKMPAVAYTVDDWPWEALGLSLVESVSSVEQTKRKHERGMDEVLTARMNPPMGYDRTSTGGPKVENFDIFEPNVRMGGDVIPNQTFQSLLPDEVQITDTNYKFQQFLKEQEERQLGINDLGSLMDAKLNLSPDSFDKALESVGPIAKGIATSMESGNAKVANMLKVMIPQWMDTARIIEYVGPDKVTSVLMDFDPSSMIPSHLIDEYVNGELPFDMVEGEVVSRASMYDQLTRARSFAKKLRLVSVPSTLLKITQAQEQAKYMALYSRDFPISPHTVAKKLGIENFGEIPGDTEFEKWVNWKKIQIAILAQERQFAAELGIGGPDSGASPNGAPPPEGGGAPSGGGPGAPQKSPPHQGVHGGGRPASDQAPPKLIVKDKKTNPRPVIKTSK